MSQAWHSTVHIASRRQLEVLNKYCNSHYKHTQLIMMPSIITFFFFTFLFFSFFFNLFLRVMNCCISAEALHSWWKWPGIESALIYYLMDQWKNKIIFHFLLFALWDCCFITFQPELPGQIYSTFTADKGLYQPHVAFLSCHQLFISFLQILFYCLLQQRVVQMNQPQWITLSLILFIGVTILKYFIRKQKV